MTDISREEYAERLENALVEQYEEQLERDSFMGEYAAISFCAQVMTDALYDVDEEMEELEDDDEEAEAALETLLDILFGQEDDEVPLTDPALVAPPALRAELREALETEDLENRLEFYRS